MRILDLSVYEVHLDNIETGAKTIEFREMTDYWIERLVDMAKLPGKTPSEVRLMLLRGFLPFCTLLNKYIDISKSGCCTNKK